MKKIILFIFLAIPFTFIGCSHLIDAIWNPNTASFEATATYVNATTAKISFTKSDHNDVRQASQCDAGKYFKAYYIYRSDDPYDKYNLIGFEAFSILGSADTCGTGKTIHTAFNERHGSSNDIESETNTGLSSFTNNRNYYDNSLNCTLTPKKVYFYRVISVYRDWDKTNKDWLDTLTDEDKSNIATYKCP